MPKPASTSGFSLVELSIVLVILGLLVGGVMGGQALIKAAELRAITSEVQGFTTAANAFRDKYRSLPGDTQIATRVWGDAGVCASVLSRSHTAPLTNGTCNGNNNGQIATNPFLVANSTVYESFLFWHHLSLAGLIPTTVTGVRGPETWGDITKENAVVSKFGGALWLPWTFNNTNSDYPSAFPVNYGNSFTLGIPQDFAFLLETGGITPSDAWNIDMKSDDGKPSTGTVMVIWQWGEACTTSDPHASVADMDAEYELATQRPVCALTFRNAF